MKIGRKFLNTIMIKPPAWQNNFNEELFRKAINSPELRELIKRAEKDYVYWDKFKYYPMPKGFKPEEAWAFLKFTRLSNKELTPVKAIDGKPFDFTITKSMFERLSRIDANTTGLLSSNFNPPTQTERNQLIISGLTEEAIASSQIEGANTSRKVAQEMLLSKRKARTRDEQMIINNYQVMQRLQEWKDIELSVEMLLDIQKNITTNTLEKEEDAGRFRNNEDGIGVYNKITGEAVFIPPNAEMVKSELKRLIHFANSDKGDEDFIHPVIKASILHFWVAYLHPFVDGNGRTSRAIFYWYLLRKNYWMFQYLSVSRVIKTSKTQYDEAYLHTEFDENDLTYFLSYKLKAIVQSINDLIAYYQQKQVKEKIIEKIVIKLGQFNERQVALLQHLNNNKEDRADLVTHQSKYRISYETARTDLQALAEKNLLSVVKVRNKYIYIPNTVAISKLLSLA